MLPPRFHVASGDDDEGRSPPDDQAPETGIADPTDEAGSDRSAGDQHSARRTNADQRADDGRRASPVAEPIAAVEGHSSALPREEVRILEAVIFASATPVDEARLAQHLKPGADVPAVLAELQALYAGRGVNLVKVAGKWAFRTADDLSWVLERHAQDERRLSRAALETLAIIAYHQPVTRAEIEEIRGVTTSKGTLDVLMETGFVRPRGRRRAPGRPVTYGTTERFLEHFGLEAIKDLPGLAELKGSGLLDANLPPDFKVPEPTDVAALMPDELPLEDGEADEESQAELDLDEPADAEDDAAETDETMKR